MLRRPRPGSKSCPVPPVRGNGRGRRSCPSATALRRPGAPAASVLVRLRRRSVAVLAAARSAAAGPPRARSAARRPRPAPAAAAAGRGAGARPGRGAARPGAREALVAPARDSSSAKAGVAARGSRPAAPAPAPGARARRDRSRSRGPRPARRRSGPGRCLRLRHGRPPSAWSRFGAAWCRRWTRDMPERGGDLGVGEPALELQGHEVALARRRGRRARRARPRGAARSRRGRRALGAPTSSGSASRVARRLRRRSSSSAALRAMPNSQASALPREARYAAALAVGALECLGGHVLGGGAVAQQRGHVGVHAREGALVEGLEALGLALGGGTRAKVPPGPRSRPYYDCEPRIHHNDSPMLKSLDGWPMSHRP